MHRITRLATWSLLLSLPLVGACDAAAGLLNLFGGVRLIVTNDTPFAAAIDLRTADSDNFLEDFFTDAQPVAGVAVVPANQSVTVTLPCDGDLELVSFQGAQFENSFGLPVGDVDADERLRRDRDFDCGDTIRIRLTGTLFNFQGTVDVDTASDTGGGLIHPGGNDNDDSDDNDDIGDLLDDLFG